MRIALDARTIFRPARRGTGKTLVDLYRHVLAARPDWQVLAFHRQVGPLPGDPLAGLRQFQAQRIEMPGDRVDAWQRWRLPMAAWRGGARALHCPANSCPSWMPVPVAVTIHDLIPLDLPEGLDPREVARFEHSVRTACHGAAWITCPSRYTADRLVRQFGADRRRLTVNPWAADSGMRRVPESRWPRVLERYGVHRPLVLHFGARERRKNTLRLIQTWADMDPALRREWQLLVVGLDPQFLRDLVVRVDGRDLSDSVRLHGFADEGDLPALLSASSVLAYPSLSEGFGLPILDAWATDTAVLTSNTTSLPEVAGDAAVLVDPADAASIGAGLTRLLENPGLCRELVAKGRARLAEYTWEATAQRFIGVMEQVAGMRSTALAAA